MRPLGVERDDGFGLELEREYWEDHELRMNDIMLIDGVRMGVLVRFPLELNVFLQCGS